MIYLSKKKHKELQDELFELINHGRQKLSEKLDDAKSFGDLKENAEYHQARDDQAKMEARIQEIEDILKNAKLIKKSKTNYVTLGSKVTITKNTSTKTQTYEIVSEIESDILEGKLSENAPLAKNMINKKVNDIFDYTTPKNEVISYKITKIN